MIYEAYFWDLRCPPAKTIHEEPPSSLGHYWKPALLAINKQIRDEILDFFRRHTTLTYRISWQESSFDEFTMSCCRVRGQKLSRSVEHLRVEIHPPHPDRPTDMMHIWREIDLLRSAINRYWTPQRLSIIFMENEIASWSCDGEPQDSMNLYANPHDDVGVSDIAYILDIFGTLPNIPKVTIELPASLDCNEDLQDYRQDCEDRMMAPFDGDYISMHRMRDDLAYSVDDAEPRLKDETAKISRAKIDAECEFGLREFSPEELQRLKHICPYNELLSDDGYCPNHTSIEIPPTSRSSRPPPSLKSQLEALISASKVADWQLSYKARKEVLNILQAMDGCRT